MALFERGTLKHQTASFIKWPPDVYTSRNQTHRFTCQKIRWFSLEKNYPILLNPVLFWKYSLFKVKVMDLICNLFSNTCKVLKNSRKHFLSIRNHTFLVKYDVTNTPTKYELVVMSIKNLSNKNKLGLYVSLY
jgi:lipid-A-disaccharide synthase-like uncharacterized protein